MGGMGQKMMFFREEREEKRNCKLKLENIKDCY